MAPSDNFLYRSFFALLKKMQKCGNITDTGHFLYYLKNIIKNKNRLCQLWGSSGDNH